MYLLIRGQSGEEGNDVTLDVIQLQDLSKLSQFGGRRAPHHGSVI